MSVRLHPTKGPSWWIIDFYPQGRKGKRVRQIFQGTKGEALAIEQDLRRAPGEVVNAVSPTVKDVVAPWLEYYHNEVSATTYKDAVNCLKSWLPYFGNFRPANITRTAINNYKARRVLDIANKAAVGRGQPPRYVKKRTINKELSYLSSLLKWAAEHSHCEELNYTIPLFPAKLTRPPAVMVLTPRQMTLLYEHADPEYKLLILLLCDMALRVAEAISLTAEDIDEYHETITVLGKGNKERILPWASERFAVELRKTLDARPSGLLTLSNKTGEKFVDTRALINRAARRAGIKRKINPHLLRHSGLTALAMKGMSPNALQNFAGHASMMTTQRIYVHVRQDFVGEEMRRIRETSK